MTTTDRPAADIVGGGRVRAQGRDRSSGVGVIVPVFGALIIGLLIGAFGGAMLAKNSSDDGFAGVVDETRYQSVILTNDKVYFGKIESISDDFFQLHSAFFLRETRDSEDAEPTRALLPVNREIHEPDNTMLIRKSEVVLVENLAKDSPILEEIKRQKGDAK